MLAEDTAWKWVELHLPHDTVRYASFGERSLKTELKAANACEEGTDGDAP